MGQATLTWLSPIIVALVTGVVTWLLTIRKSSGRIATTEAGQLWEEAAGLRAAYQVEIKRLEDQNRELRGEVTELRRKTDMLERENARLTARVVELENGGRVHT